ncbi:hypothetical protein NSQ62_11785 [Solibacillus sp. FSL H8-0523]|uniref:hypothetical protein n=1 Tax=Solibacillus sp. FSL H8-0523 TaxID=2954511 RepID=UPI003100B91A
MKVINCTHCGSDGGFYTKETVKGRATVYYTNNGDYAENQTEMYSLNNSGGKVAHCVDCNKKIGNSADLISGNAEKSY